MAMSEVVTPVVDRIAVGVVVAREPVAGNRWIDERWRVAGVVCGAALAGERDRRVLREGPEGTQYLWPGLELRLLPADAESYYYNLRGDNPSLYVYCETEASGEPVPLRVDAEYIDAMWHQEFGNAVFAVPMPPEVYHLIERFAAAHYVPEEPRRKRKRDAVPGDGGGRA
jgi:hypothetical protein